MIAKVGPKRQSGHASFTDLRMYLERDSQGLTREDLIGTWSANVASHRTADIEMEHVAQRGRSKDPVYHLILSWRPHEEVGLNVVRDAIDVTLRSLSAEDQQWFAATHIDEKDGRTHLHLVVNKTNPIGYQTLNCWRDQFKLARATEYIEAEHGCLVDRRADWRKHLPELDLGVNHAQAQEQVLRSLPERVRIAPQAALQNEMDKAHRAGYSWVTLLQRDVIPAVLTKVEQSHATWHDVHATLETYGVHCERAGSGLRIVGAEIGQRARASRVGLDFGALEAKLGTYEACRVELNPLEAKFPEIKQILREKSSWNDLHVALQQHGLAVEQRGLGGRLLDLQDGQQSIPLGRLGTSMPRLRARLGNYEMPASLSARQDRDSERADAALSERLAAVAQEPQLLLERVAAHNSVWTQADIEYELARIVGTDREALKRSHAQEISATVAAIVASSSVIGSIELPAFKDDPEPQLLTYMSLPAIIEAEQQALSAFMAAHERERPTLQLRPASSELDQQQQSAYAYMADGSSDLRIVTGIAGAGKSRLLRDVSAAYTEAGFTVIGSAVAGDAARTLGEEAEIAAMTTARLLMDVEQGRLHLTPSSVVLLDEATQLGTTDGLRLAQAINAAGARLIATGDLAQHESVARGPILSELVQRIEVADLSETRRANAEWLRSVGKDMREGRTTRALDTMREHGAIGEYETRSDAMRVLVDRYVADIRAGRTAVMVATTRRVVDELNVLTREALGDALGERRDYSTAYGQRDFAIGDQVVTRRGVRDVRTMDEQRIHIVNGEQWVVVGHRDDGRLALQHARSGVEVAWDIAAYPEVDWSMATTSYRSQGRTVDAAYALVTESDARRGLYVDITRAREDVLVVYAREDLVDFGEFLAVGGRERAKMTVAATQRYIAEHEARTENDQLRTFQGSIGEHKERTASKADELALLQKDSVVGEEQSQQQNAPIDAAHIDGREIPAHDVSREPMTYAAIEADALQQVNNPQRLEELTREYRARFGNIIDTDNARELFPAYAQADKETRAQITQAVHEASSRIAQNAWEQRISERAESIESNYVVFLAGGSGSGKGTIKEFYLEEFALTGETLPHAMYDTTLSNYESSQSRIEAALSAGMDVEIRYIHRPIEAAARGIAERQAFTGRSVSNDILAATHYGAQQSLLQLSHDYKDNNRVRLMILDNSGERSEYRFGTIEQTILPHQYTSQQDALHRITGEKEHERSQRVEIKQSLQRIGERTSSDPRKAWENSQRSDVEEPRKGRGEKLPAPSKDASREGQIDNAISNDAPSYVTLSVTRIGWKLEPIADGSATDYSADERQAAKGLMKAMEPLEPQEQLRVARDLHVQLRKPEELHQQIAQTRDAAKERAQQRDRAQDHDRGFER